VIKENIEKTENKTNRIVVIGMYEKRRRLCKLETRSGLAMLRRN
jgi:hypothetical protein